jgi:hypothetical protein
MNTTGGDFPGVLFVNRLGGKWFETQSVSSSAHGACAVRRFVGPHPTRITEDFVFRTTATLGLFRLWTHGACGASVAAHNSAVGRRPSHCFGTIGNIPERDARERRSKE